MARDDQDPSAEQPEQAGTGGVRPDGAEGRPGPGPATPDPNDQTQTEWRSGEMGTDEPHDDKTRTASGIVLPTERKQQGPEVEDEDGAVRDSDSGGESWPEDGATLTEFEAGGEADEDNRPPIERLGVLEEHEPWLEDGPTLTGFEFGEEFDEEASAPLPDLQEVGHADLPWLEDGPTVTGFELGDEHEEDPESEPEPERDLSLTGIEIEAPSVNRDEPAPGIGAIDDDARESEAPEPVEPEHDDEAAPPLPTPVIGEPGDSWLEDGPTLTGFEFGEEFDESEPERHADETHDEKTRTASGIVFPTERKKQGPEVEDEEGAVRDTEPEPEAYPEVGAADEDWLEDGPTLTGFEFGEEHDESEACPAAEESAEPKPDEHEPNDDKTRTASGIVFPTERKKQGPEVEDEDGAVRDTEPDHAGMPEVGESGAAWLGDGPTLTGFDLGEDLKEPDADEPNDDKTRAASGIVFPTERKKQGPEVEDEDGAVRDVEPEPETGPEFGATDEPPEAIETEPVERVDGNDVAEPPEQRVVSEADESWLGDGLTLTGFAMGEEEESSATPTEGATNEDSFEDDGGTAAAFDPPQPDEPANRSWLGDGPTLTGSQIDLGSVKDGADIVFLPPEPEPAPAEPATPPAPVEIGARDDEEDWPDDGDTAEAFNLEGTGEAPAEVSQTVEEETPVEEDASWIQDGPTLTGFEFGEDFDESDSTPEPEACTPLFADESEQQERPPERERVPLFVDEPEPAADATLTTFGSGTTQSPQEEEKQPNEPTQVPSVGAEPSTQTDLWRSSQAPGKPPESSPSGQPASREESDPDRTETQSPYSHPDPTGAGAEHGADQGVAADEPAATHSFPGAADAGEARHGHDATHTDLFGPARNLPPPVHTPVSGVTETDSDPLRDSMPIYHPPAPPAAAETPDEDRTATDVGFDDDMPEGTQTGSHEFRPEDADEDEDQTRTLDEGVVPYRAPTAPGRGGGRDETVSVFETFGDPVRVPDAFAAEAPEEPERPKLPPKTPKRSRRRHDGGRTMSPRERIAYWLHLLLTVVRREAQQGDEAIRGIVHGLRTRLRRGGWFGTGLTLRDLLIGFASTEEGDARIHSLLEAAVGEGSFLGQHVRPREVWAWLRGKIPSLADLGRARRKSLEALRETIRGHTDLKAAKNAKWWRKTLVEIGSLFAIVVPIELVLNKGAVGSFGFHPHPYWLIVLPMAGARGVVAGLISAGVASLLYVIGAHGALMDDEVDFWTLSNLLEPVLFFGVGFFLGELHDELAARYRKLEQRIEDVQERIARLRRERDVLGDANKELEKRIVDDSVQFGNLIVAATRIENADRKEVFDIALELVEEHCGAASSVLIRLEDGSLDFLCHRGWSGEETSDRLASARKSEFVARAVAEGMVVNGFQPDESTPEDGPLVVAPLFDATGVVKALLCLDEIPATRLNESTIRVFLGIADWISSALARLAHGHDAPDPRRAMGALAPNAEMTLGNSDELGDRLRLELERCARYGVPTSLLTIHAVEWTDASSEGLANLDRFVLTHFTSGLRPSDSLYHFGYPGCYLIVLAGTSVDGAEVVRTRMLRRLDYAPSRTVGEIEIKTSGPDAEAPDLKSLVERVAGELREASPIPLEGRCPVRVPERSDPGGILEFVRRVKMETSLAVRNGFDLHVVGIEADLDDRDLEPGLLARHVHEIGQEILRPTDGVFTIGPRHCAIVLPCTDGESAAMVSHRIVTGLRDRDARAPYGDLETRVMGLGPSNPDAGSFLKAFSAPHEEESQS